MRVLWIAPIFIFTVSTSQFNYARASEFKNFSYSNAQGSVSISKISKDSFQFSLENFSLATVNVFAPARPEDADPRFCLIEGTARLLNQTTAIYESGKKESNDYCQLEFKIKDELLHVGSTDCELCTSTSPDGIFRFDDGKCEAEKLRSRRAAFNADFKAKRFTDSVIKLESLLADCKINLSNPDTSWLLNDLALARYKAGDKKGCLAAIAEIPMGLEGKLAKAVKFNQQLCKK